jgi:hypothetical protein
VRAPARASPRCRRAPARPICQRHSCHCGAVGAEAAGGRWQNGGHGASMTSAFAHRRRTLSTVSMELSQALRAPLQSEIERAIGCTRSSQAWRLVRRVLAVAIVTNTCTTSRNSRSQRPHQNLGMGAGGGGLHTSRKHTAADRSSTGQCESSGHLGGSPRIGDWLSSLLIEHLHAQPRPVLLSSQRWLLIRCCLT